MVLTRKQDGSDSLSLRVMVPSKSVKKIHLGFAFKVSGYGIFAD